MTLAKKIKEENETYFNSLSTATQDIVKQTLFRAYENVEPQGYKDDESCLESIECERRDGFIPNSYNHGGLIYRNFTDLMEYFGSGFKVFHEEVAEDIQKQIDYAFETIRQDIFEDHKNLCLRNNIDVDNCDYWSLQQFVETSNNLTHEEKKELNQMLNDIQEMESERLSGDDSSIMHELRFMYHGKENGLHSASVSAAINTEAPYHRSSISWAKDVFCEGSNEVEIAWKTDKELKSKLAKALKHVTGKVF